jgi:hypothetical protein
MGVRVIVMMGVGHGGNHQAMLYYNIEPVHGGSGLAYQHGNSRRDKRERDRNRSAEPHESGWHERDFPQNHPLKGGQRSGDDVGDHLRPTAARLHRHRADGKADHGAAGRGGAGDHGGQNDGGSDARVAQGYARRGANSAQQKSGRNATASLGPSFRDDASAPDLRCAIAHREISRFHNAQLRIGVRPSGAPE